MISSKSKLAVALSRLKPFAAPDVRLEQYTTDSEVAAAMLWHAYMRGDIEGKRIADFGCGTGILGIGALLLGASKVFFVEKDASAVATLAENLSSLGLEEGYTIMPEDIAGFDDDVDVVIENPPFGTRDEHIDRFFLGKAFSVADTVYSFHKTSTKGFVEKFATDNGYKVYDRLDFRFPLKQTQSFHKKRLMRIEVSCFCLTKA